METIHSPSSGRHGETRQPLGWRIPKKFRDSLRQNPKVARYLLDTEVYRPGTHEVHLRLDLKKDLGKTGKERQRALRGGYLEVLQWCRGYFDALMWKSRSKLPRGQIQKFGIFRYCEGKWAQIGVYPNFPKFHENFQNFTKFGKWSEVRRR